MWRYFVMNIKAEKFMIRMTKTKALNAWIYFCHLEQERRIRLEKEAQERLIRLQAEIDATNEESERILMQKDVELDQEHVRGTYDDQSQC